MLSEKNRIIFGEKVRGVDVDEQTRCGHYHSAVDVIAIKFKCCAEWFPCYECHRECTSHSVEVWAKNEFEERAILCGVCGCQLTIAEYLKCSAICPNCQAQFNPECANHYELYFELDIKSV